MVVLFCLFVGGTIVALLLERVVHAFCLVAWHIVHGTESDVKTFSAFGVMSSVFTGWMNLILSIGAVSTTVLGALVNAGQWILKIVLIGLLCTFILEYYPQLIEDTIHFWNDGFGAILRGLVYETAHLGYLFLSVLLPLYNAITYISMKVFSAVIVSGLQIDLSALLSFLGAFWNLLLHIVNSLSAYLLTFDNCSTMVNSTMFNTTNACFEPGLRMLDLITPMGDLRLMAGHAVHILDKNCALLAAPLDLILYPLMDINLAKAVHNLVNSVLLAVLHVPIITYERCKFSHSGGGPLSVLMCVPDFEPVWNTIFSGMRFLGLCLDNWLNIVTVILEEVITGDSPVCAAAPLAQDVSAPSPSLFGTNKTVTVGLTPDMYATTDGWSTQYTIFTRATERLLVTHSWPMKVDISLGIAAVRYTDADERDKAGHPTTAMLGCRCDDVEGSISITCAISPYGVEVYDTLHLRWGDYVLPVSFQLPSTADYLTCSKVQISVQSVRWPLTRLARPDLSGVLRDVRDPLQNNNVIEEPRELDAVIYVVPRCSVDTVVDLACIESFTKMACYPYCMAGRMTGSMNNALVLYDSDDWEANVQLLKRDCGLGTITVTDDFQTGGFTYTRDSTIGSYSSRYDMQWNDVGGTTYTTGSVPGDASRGACTYNINVATRTKRELLPGYGNLDSIRLGEQPFVVAGDASLFIELENTDDGNIFNDVAYVRVKRLFGSEVSQFTLLTMDTKIPTMGTCQSMETCTNADLKPSMITVPRAYSRSPANAAPAVATKWSVLFAVNPSPDIYAAFFMFCQNRSNVGLQFQIDSAYGPIRIWRIDAFVENAYLKAQLDRDDVSLTIEAFDGKIDAEACANPINMAVVGMTYLNEYNVAVTVLRASPRYYDIETGAPRPDAPPGTGEVAYDVHYLNPRTMKIRMDELWEEEPAVSTLAQGYLCPAMRRMPPMGSLFAETALIFATAVRYPVTLVTNIPALIPGNLRYIRECPLITRGHTMLRECGVNIFSLDYYFQSVGRANNYFWSTFSYIGAAFQGIPNGGEQTRTFLNGVAVTGSYGFFVVPQLPWVQFPVNALVGALPLSVSVFFRMAGLSRVLYEFTTEMVVELLSFDQYNNFGALVNLLWSKMYDMRLRYDEIVTTPAVSACTGLGITLGWSNPVAQISRDMCLGIVAVVPAVLDMGNVLFVHYPILACMCKMDGGAQVQKTAAQKCFNSAPLQYRPIIAQVIAEGTGQVKGMCIAMSNVANTQLKQVPDPLFEIADNIAEEVSGAVQYMVSFFTGETSCTNFYTSPYVMTLMPYPIDYFRMCGTTSTCKERCQSLFEAFELSRATGGVKPDKQQSIIIQKSMATESDILNRQNLLPFDVLAVIEHPSCTATCGDVSGKTARCFSVAGVDAGEYVSVALYCVPSGVQVGLREVVRWRVEGSNTWTASLIDIKFLSIREPPKYSGPYDPIMIVRRDGILICGPDGIIQHPLTVVEGDLVYVSSPRTLREVDHVYVVPVTSGTAQILVHGKTQRISLIGSGAIITENVCVTVKVNVQSVTPIYGVYFSPLCPSKHNLPVMIDDAHMSFTPGLSNVVIVPIDTYTNLKFCNFSVTEVSISGCKELPNESVLYNAASTLRTLGTRTSTMFTMTRQGVTVRRNDVAAQTTAYALTVSGETVYAIFKSDNGGSTALWVSNIQLFVGSQLSMKNTYTTPMELSVTIQNTCNVMSCTGCASTSTQKLCYAAQQCAIAKCVGTTVNMQYPACMVGMLLKEIMQWYLSKLRAVWIVLYEILHLVVDLSTGQIQSKIKMTFPYDAVDIVMCDLKDVIVSFFAVLMSTVNSIILGFLKSIPDELYKTSNTIASQATLLLASVTNFLSHLVYGVLYMQFATFQMTTCLTNSALAVFDVVGISARILPASEDGWDKVGGQCMTKMAGESLNEFGSTSKANFLKVVDQMFTAMTKATAGAQFESVIHYIDAGITWAVGVTKGLQDIMQVADVAHCRTPDMTMKHLVQCACDDTAVRIPDTAASMGLRESAFWCSGPLSLVLSDGSQRTVFNPYTLQELRAKVEGTLDDYLNCISGGYELGLYTSCHSLEPTDSFLNRQGVSVLQVYTRCRSNYVARQWDEAAALLFNATLDKYLVKQGTVIKQLFDAENDVDPAVRRCMLQSLNEGLANDRCLDTHLQLVGLKKSEYFAYEDTIDTVDACEVFSGPAKRNEPDFVACMDDAGIVDTTLVSGTDTSTACELPFFLWSGRSRNRIPVASPHLKLTSTDNTDRFVIARNMIMTAISKAVAALRQYLDEWKGESLKVSLFTSEGDALHQALDCMMMGPYAATDLWPGDGIDFMLPSARYSRQSDVSDATLLSREFELPCSGERLRGDRYPPFTCGSTARRSIMKYFVRDAMTSENNDYLKEVVINETLAYFTEVLQHWTSIDDYGCPCTDNTVALSCCSESDTDGWVAFLGDNTRRKRISGSKLTANLIDNLVNFVKGSLLTKTHTVLTKYADEEQDYTWTIEEALIATDLGLYDIMAPVIFYDENEAASPFKRNASLFDICVAHISAAMFTQPLRRDSWHAIDEAFNPTDASLGLDGFMSVIESYVSRVTKSALDNVPSYWHNVLRHVPSDSTVCLDHVQTQGWTSDYMKINKLNADSRFNSNVYDIIRNNLGEMQSIMEKNAGTELQDIPSSNLNTIFSFFGWGANTLSGMNDKCVCGWKDNTGCYISDEVCVRVSRLKITDSRFTALSDICNRDIVTGQNTRAYYDIASQWWQVHVAIAATSVKCNDMGPSDAWGVLEKDASQQWAQGLPIAPDLSVYSFLTEGRSGMRLGNLHQIAAKWNEVINPSRRHKPLVHPSDPMSTAGQRICKKSLSVQVFKTDLLSRYVDEFFPVSQGIRNSPAMEYCTRYMIELARKQAFNAVNVSFTDTTQTWRKRCMSQLNVIDMCNVRGVFDVVPITRVSPGCPFTVSGLPSTSYVTPTCLVYDNKKFHDPCRCFACNNTVITIANVRSCPLPLDIRQLVKHPSWGGHFHWAQKFPQYMSDEKIAILQKAISDLVTYHEEAPTPLAMNANLFVNSITDTSGLFNTAGQWRTAEGISKDTGSSLYCDSVIDWWPEDWENPVGYHVTTPPYANEAGYRVFDNSFVVDRGNGVYIVYEHDYLRNKTLAVDRFGASGTCGVHSYSMPMQELNTMRVCTSTSTDDLADPDVPIRSSRRPNSGDSALWFSEQCAATTDVPWEPASEVDYDTHFSAGLVSHWGVIDITQWPTYGKILPKTRPVDTSEFGGTCFLPGQSTCENESDCDDLAVRSLDKGMSCFNGVCGVRSQKGATFECSRHEHCTNGKMCSGWGVCVEPQIIWTNDLPEQIEAHIYSEQCGTKAYAESMVGASPWERYENLLPDAGFCSYRSWFEYSDLLNVNGCKNTCDLQSDKVGIRSTSTNAPVIGGSVWDQHRYRMSPHVCDRDYQHIEGFSVCTPQQTSLTKARVMRTLEEDRKIALNSGTVWNNKTFGFLGLTQTFNELYDNVTGISALKFCSDIPQCHLQRITMNGFEQVKRKAINKTALVNNVEASYNSYVTVGYRDVFTCGSFGLYVGNAKGECILDPAVTPLWHIICDPQTLDIAQSCPWTVDWLGTLETFKATICQIRYSGTVIQSSLPFYMAAKTTEVASFLNKLSFSAIKTTFTTFSGYRALATCAEKIWDRYTTLPKLQHPYTFVWTDAGEQVLQRPEWLYHYDEVFPHALTEFPFAWWVKCNLFSGIVPKSNEFTPCYAWDTRTSDYTPSGEETVKNFLFRFNGVITQQWWDSNINYGQEAISTDCSSTLSAVSKLNEQELLAMYLDVRSEIFKREGITDSFSRTCYDRKEFDLDKWWTSSIFMNDVFSYITYGEPSVEQYTYSSGEYTRKVSPYLSRVWSDLCEHWFEDKDWFKVMDDAAILMQTIDKNKGIDVGYFKALYKDDLEDIIKQLALTYSPGQCQTSSKIEGVNFCIFKYAPNEDPKILYGDYDIDVTVRPYVMVQTDINLIDLLATSRPFDKYGFDSNGAYYTDICDSDNGRFTEQLQSIRFGIKGMSEADYYKFGDGNWVNLEKYLYSKVRSTSTYGYYNAVFKDTHDMLGQACDLNRKSMDDVCQSTWVYQYRQHTKDNLLNCKTENTISLYEHTRWNKDVPIIHNPKGDVCWGKGSTCLGGLLGRAKAIRFPPGIDYTLYVRFEPRIDDKYRKDFEWEVSGERITRTGIPYVPGWQHCPTNDYPKSYGYGNPIWQQTVPWAFKNYKSTPGNFKDVYHIKGDGFDSDSLRVKLGSGTFCCTEDNCFDVCKNNGFRDFSLQVRRNLYFCGIECTQTSRVYCTGEHSCRHSTFRGLKDREAAQLNLYNIPTSGTMSFPQLVQGIHLIAKQILQDTYGKDGRFYIKPESNTKYFVASGIDKFDSFDSTPSREYTNSLSAGTDAPLQKCAELDNTGAGVDYTNCSNSEFLQEFKEFVDKEYRRHANVVIPAASSVAWSTTSDQLLGMNIMAYAANNRKNEEVFVSWLLNLPARCKDTTIYNSICHQLTNGFKLINPWPGGDFNPTEFCDTPLDTEENVRVVNVFCNKAMCPGYYTGNAASDPFYKGVPKACLDPRRGPASQRMPRRSSSYNLCARSPLDTDQCYHQQGVLGGMMEGSGVAVDGNTVDDLYSTIPRSSLQTVGGLFYSDSNMGRNRLFEGKLRYEVGYGRTTPIRLSPYDIGGHNLHFIVDRNGSLRVHDIILGNNLARPMTSLQWLESYESLINTEDNPVPVGSGVSWDCPYLRLQYWGRYNENLRAPTPNTRRAQVMFSAINQNKLAHPLMAPMPPVAIIHYSTSNGRCLCISPEDCISTIDKTDGCSLLGTIRSMYNEEWVNVVPLYKASNRICSEQLDWPYINGTLRDNSTLFRDAMTRNCSILERLPVFRYRLKNVLLSKKEAQSTGSEGGDCHTGYAARRDKTVESRRCHVHEKTKDTITLMCDDGQKRTLAREKSLAPQWVVDHAMKARRKCSDTDSMPTFKTKDGTSMPSASSFGIHTRISAERFIASDLYRIICENIDCNSTLAKEKWKTGEFLSTMLNDPTQLFKNVYYSPTKLQDGGPSDAPLWNESWVSCKRDETTRLLSNCTGNVSRADWINPVTRMPACKKAIIDNTDQDLAMDLTLCDLDGQTDTLCSYLAQAEHDIQEAHCIAAGACLRETFYYHPATYSTTNEEFVRKTVEEFYLSVSDTSCPLAAQERAQLIKQLKSLEEECSAVWLNSIIDLLESTRTIIHMILRILYYLLMIVLNMFRVVVDPLNANEIFDNVLYYFVQLLEEIVEMIKMVGQMMWLSVQKSPIGMAIKNMVQQTCRLIIVIADFIKGTICRGLADFIKEIRSVVESVRNVYIFGAQPIKSVIPHSVVEALITAENKLRNCINVDSIQCETEDRNKTGSSMPKPSPTRCWSQYITTLGDSGPLSCTAADTCVSGISDDRMICDSCPSTPAGINHFGCDPIRKVCACGVLQMERTPCLNHEQCTLQSDATCVFLDDNYEVTFGTTKCSQCSNTPKCVKTTGQTTGFCSCPLAQVEEEPCNSDAIGSSVFPSATGLCLAAVGSAATTLSQDTTFNAEYPRMLSIPCRMADISQTFCFSVQYDAFSTVPRIVVLDMLVFQGGSGPFRRLLSTRDWGSGLCSAIVSQLSAADALSATDQEYMKQCHKWYTTGELIINEYNLTGVPPYFLLSVSDFSNAVSSVETMEQLLSRPVWLLAALAHSEYLRPLIAFAKVIEKWVYLVWPHFTLPRVGQTANHTANHTETWATFTTNHRALLATSAFYPPLDTQADNVTLKTLGRTLKEWRDQLSAVQQFSVQVTLSGEPTQKLSPEAAKVWLQGPTKWPPDYSYWTGSECVTGKLLSEILLYSLNATAHAYAKTGPAAMVPASSFRESMITVPSVYTEETLPIRDSANVSKTDYLSRAFLELRNVLETLGLTRVAVYNLFAAIPGTVNDFFTCDLEKVMFCTRYRRTVWYSFWWVLIYACIILLIIQIAQLPFQTILFISALTIIVLFYATEYSVLCIPMLPPCVLDELIEILSMLIPTRLHWPNALQTYPGCISGDTSMRPEGIDPSASCVVSCSAEPHSFTRWEAPMAWWICDFDPQGCRNFAGWLKRKDIAFSQTLQHYLIQKAELIDTLDNDLLWSQRICASLTSWYILPWVVLALALLYMLTWGTIIPFLVAQSAVQTFAQSLQMTHVTGRSLKRHTNIFVNRAMRRKLE